MFPKFPTLTPNSGAVRIYGAQSGYSGASSGQDYPIFIPQDKSTVTFFLFGGGGGGGGGNTAALGATTYGGGGGGSGGMTSGTFPIEMLPRVLYFTAGRGGPGGGSNVGGTAGQVSYLKVDNLNEQGSSSGNLMYANGGSAGASAGTAGGAASAASVGFMNGYYYCPHNLKVLSGNAGGAGGNGAAGATVTALLDGSRSPFVLGGCGGGGTTAGNAGQNGGYYTGHASALQFTSILPALAAAGVAGSGGVHFDSSYLRFINFGGTGGGGNTVASGTGGAGGNGAPGCGGGGGGGCNGTSAVGGRGGDGGDGFLLAIYT